VEQGVSLSCSVYTDGCVEWRAVKESGTFRGSGVYGVSKTQPVAYVAVKWIHSFSGAAWCEVALSLLTWDSVRVVRQEILEMLCRKQPATVEEAGVGRGVDLVQWQREAGELFERLSLGAFSSVVCECVECTMPCAQCALVPVEWRRFVRQPRYGGVFPLKDRGWFSGVTDSVGEVTGVRSSWGEAHAGVARRRAESE
jgi:hypothetical protein